MEEQQQAQVKQKRPQTSKRTRPTLGMNVLASSGQHLQGASGTVLMPSGPSSTKNLRKPRGSVHTKAMSLHGITMADIVTQPVKHGDLAYEQKASVAERSVLSQNFIIGDEKSEKSLIGSSSSNDGDSRPYEKFRDEVNKLSRVSTAATHPEFISEICQKWQSFKEAKHTSLGVNSFNKARFESELILSHMLKEDILFRKNPDLLDFKKKNYVDPDKIAADTKRCSGKHSFQEKRAPKKAPINALIKGNNGLTFGLYKRFDWEHPQLQSAIQMGVKPSDGGTIMGASQRVSKSRQGMFSRDKVTKRVDTNPGPAAYFQDCVFGQPKSKKNNHEFPRQVRKTASGMARPDYDGRAFYQDKGPGVKIKIRGALITNTTAVDHTVDRHKINYPGVATYSDQHAYSKTTFNKKTPAYSIAQGGAYSLEAVKGLAACVNDRKKK